MKKTLAIFATTMLAALLLTACGGRNLNANEKELVGTWDLYSMSIFVDGEELEMTVEEFPELASYGYNIVFKDNGTVEMTMDGTAKGNFSMSDNGTITIGRTNDSVTAYLQNGLLVIDDEAVNEEVGMDVTISFAKQ